MEAKTLSTGVGNLRPAGRIRPPHGFIRPTCACRNYKYSLCEYRFPLKILMKINESLAKINTAVSTYCRHLNITTMILKKSENED